MEDLDHDLSLGRDVVGEIDYGAASPSELTNYAIARWKNRAESIESLARNGLLTW